MENAGPRASFSTSPESNAFLQGALDGQPATVVTSVAQKKKKQWFERGADVYEQPRWGLIEEALRAPVIHVALINPFLPPEVQKDICLAQQLEDDEEIPLVCVCASRPSDRKAAQFRDAAVVVDEDEGPLPRPAAARRAGLELVHSPLLPCCFLSGAAVLAAQALHVQPGEKVLDLCAGPGAKALMLASMLFAPAGDSDPDVGSGVAEWSVQQPGSGDRTSSRPAGADKKVLEPPVSIGSFVVGAKAGGRLVCNEPHRQRCAVLQDVLSSFLPEALLSKGGPVVFTSCEASHKVPPALRAKGPFDKVLVDPPCSAVRRIAKEACVQPGGHVNPVTRGAWQSDASTLKKNSAVMEDLLRCAGALVRPGGLIVYCTSSLETKENDEVVRKFLQRMGDDFEVLEGEDDEPIAGAECTEGGGTLILPDQGTLHGPLYFARFRRRRDLGDAGTGKDHPGTSPPPSGDAAELPAERLARGGGS